MSEELKAVYFPTEFPRSSIVNTLITIEYAIEQGKVKKETRTGGLPNLWSVKIDGVNAELKPEFYGLAQKLEDYCAMDWEGKLVPDTHEFFKHGRWTFCINGDQVLYEEASARMSVPSVPFLEEQDGVFRSAGDLKNYDDTIKKYFDWLVPKLAYDDGRYESKPFAATLYEEHEHLEKYFISSTGEIRLEQEPCSLFHYP